MRTLHGKIKSGLGDFSKRMERIPGLLDAYERKTGLRFFPGTLNIELDEEYIVHDDAMLLDKAEYGGTVSVFVVPCTILGRNAFILRTEKNEQGTGQHPRNIIEIATDVRLRSTYDLTDEDGVEVFVPE